MNSISEQQALQIPSALNDSFEKLAAPAPGVEQALFGGRSVTQQESDSTGSVGKEKPDKDKNIGVRPTMSLFEQVLAVTKEERGMLPDCSIYDGKIQVARNALHQPMPEGIKLNPVKIEKEQERRENLLSALETAAVLLSDANKYQTESLNRLKVLNHDRPDVKKLAMVDVLKKQEIIQQNVIHCRKLAGIMVTTAESLYSDINFNDPLNGQKSKERIILKAINQFKSNFVSGNFSKAHNHRKHAESVEGMKDVDDC